MGGKEFRFECVNKGTFRQTNSLKYLINQQGAHLSRGPAGKLTLRSARKLVFVGFPYCGSADILGAPCRCSYLVLRNYKKAETYMKPEMGTPLCRA